MPINPNRKIEIAHDILAREVYARIDATDKMRLKVAQFLRDYYDRYQAGEVLLDKKDLDYIGPFLDHIQLSPEQESFIDESRREVAAKARSLRQRTLAAATLLAAASVAAIFFWWQATQAFHELRDSKEKIVNNLIIDAERLMKGCRGEEALSLLNNGKEVLPSYPPLEKAYENLADEGVKNAGRWFRKLRYEDALVVLNFASSRRSDPLLFNKPYFEAIYVFGETHQFEKAAKAWSQSPFGNAGPAFSNGKDTLLQIRENLRKIDAHLYEEMQARYYPDMVLVPGGVFEMGCKKGRDKNCHEDEKLHTVMLDSFWIARTETTVWQYFLYTQANKGKERPKGAGDKPVAFVSWFDAVDYANWVSKQLKRENAIDKEGNFFQVGLHSPGYRLPTEAEWEFAARGGLAAGHGLHQYAGGNWDILDSLGWYNSNSGLKVQPVQQLKPNALGLYDMSGNLWEWCWDWYAGYPESLRTGYKGPDKDQALGRVLRGGAYVSEPAILRCSNRHHYTPQNRLSFIGFRLARSAAAE